MNFVDARTVHIRIHDQSIHNDMKKLTVPPLRATMLLLAGLIVGGCSPTVKVEAPDKPITINMNIKIDHEIRVKVDRDIDNVVGKRSDIF